MSIGIAGRRSRHARAHVFCCVFCLVTGGFGGFVGGFWVFATRRWLACFSRVFGVFGLVGFALVAGLV